MPSPRKYATAGAFRRALEERLKRASLTEQIDPNRLRRQVSFDRLLAGLFREEPAPWVLKGGYALELRFKAARSTVDIDLTVQRGAPSAGGDGDWLGFAGIESSRVLMIAREQQFAEKIHAYTLPRNAANSRVKDLVDLALLIVSGGLDKQRILDALRLTFERRGTHDLASLLPPPADWQIPFQAMAEECGIPIDIAAVFARVQEFVEEVLAQRTER